MPWHGIYEAKGRPSFNPLIVHLADAADIGRYAYLPEGFDRLAGFWPGPLTLLLPLRADAGLSPLVTAGLAKVAIRIPAHPVARALFWHRFSGQPAAGRT
ncbi:L-threonylcarbamoyladenylate synthase [Falsirhodobacter sp. alg1]|uniref:L-threonylcarbamoyladenylate synthase n=1 Tax=Falsirhodobacter sp. alg1 TaxID=1472418 RepID=UPI000AE08DEA